MKTKLVEIRHTAKGKVPLRLRLFLDAALTVSVAVLPTVDAQTTIPVQNYLHIFSLLPTPAHGSRRKVIIIWTAEIPPTNATG
jgi:hypothetical protein